MTLNELFRRTGEPTYHTPIAVIGELVNQQGWAGDNHQPAVPFAAESMAQRLGEETTHREVVLLHIKLPDEETTYPRFDVREQRARSLHREQTQAVRKTGRTLPTLRTAV